MGKCTFCAGGAEVDGPEAEVIEQHAQRQNLKMRVNYEITIQLLDFANLEFDLGSLR